eukprot:5020150-Prymnesium_polylepis.1
MGFAVRSTLAARSGLRSLIRTDGSSDALRRGLPSADLRHARKPQISTYLRLDRTRTFRSPHAPWIDPLVTRGWIDPTEIDPSRGGIQSRGPVDESTRLDRSTGSTVRGWPIEMCLLDRCGCDWTDPPGGSIQRPSGSISGGWIDPRPVGLIQGRTFPDAPRALIRETTRL